MVATLVDLSRRGDQGWPLPQLAVLAHAELLSWIAAANAQNQGQLLTVIAGPADAAGYTGWTIKARLLDESPPGTPVELFAQWVLDEATGLITAQVGLSANYNPAGGLGAHGLISGLYGDNTGALSKPSKRPLAAVVAKSLTLGQEYFLLSIAQHTATNRQGMPLLIAKDTTSGNWLLCPVTMLTAPAGPVLIAWNRAAGRAALSGAFAYDSSGLLTVLRRPAQCRLSTPFFSTPRTSVLVWDPVVLPADFAVYGNRSSNAFGYLLAADGSEWLGVGGSRLMVRMKEAP